MSNPGNENFESHEAVALRVGYNFLLAAEPDRGGNAEWYFNPREPLAIWNRLHNGKRIVPWLMGRSLLVEAVCLDEGEVAGLGDVRFSRSAVPDFQQTHLTMTLAISNEDPLPGESVGLLLPIEPMQVVLSRAYAATSDHDSEVVAEDLNNWLIRALNRPPDSV